MSQLGIALELYQSRFNEWDTISQEHLIPLRLGLTIADMMHRITKTIRTNLTFWNHDYKQSELKAFYHDHKYNLDRLLKSPSVSIPALSLPIPDGMIENYPVTLTKLVDLYTSQTLISALKFKTGKLTAVKHDLAGKFHEDSLTEILNQALTNPKDVSDHPTNIVDSLGQLFSKQRFEVKSSTVLIPTQADWQQCLQLGLQFDDFFHEAFKLKPIVETLNQTVDSIVSHFSNNLDRSHIAVLKLLYRLVLQCGQLIDGYGALLYDMQRVEHNLVLCFKLLLKTAK